MKSKRVTKLLACVLAASMGAVPVSAANLVDAPTEAGTDAGKTFTSDVAVEKVALKVKVSPQFKVKLNPFYAGAAGTVSGGGIGSDEFIVSNNTSSNGQEVKVMCTVTAQVTKKAPDVKLYYTPATFGASEVDPSSKVKKAHMDLKGIYGTGVQLSGNNYNSGGGSQATIPVTMSKTSIDLKLGGYGQSDQMGAFAVIGDANVGAGWKDTDLSTSVAYKLKAIPSSATPAAITPLPDITVVSANLATSGITIAGDTTLTAALIKDANVFGVQFHSPDNLFADVTMQSTETAKVTVTKTPDTTNPEHAKWKVELPKTSPFVANLNTNYKDYKGKTIDVIVFVDDGQRFVGRMQMQ